MVEAHDRPRGTLGRYRPFRTLSFLLGRERDRARVLQRATFTGGQWNIAPPLPDFISAAFYSSRYISPELFLALAFSCPPFHLSRRFVIPPKAADVIRSRGIVGDDNRTIEESGDPRILGQRRPPINFQSKIVFLVRTTRSYPYLILFLFILHYIRALASARS